MKLFHNSALAAREYTYLDIDSNKIYGRISSIDDHGYSARQVYNTMHETHRFVRGDS